MFIASKLQDIIPMFLHSVHKHLGQGKLTMDKIRTRELDILTTLNFDLTIVTPLDLLDAIATNFNLSDLVYKTA